MKKMARRLISLMLCVLMLVGAMSSTALAAKSTKKSKKINKAYSKVLKKYNDKYYNDDDAVCYYSLFDMTGDSTKELIVTHGDCEQGKMHDIYTYKNGKSKKIGSIWAWHSSLGYKKKKVLLNYQGQDGATIHSVKVKNGKIVEKKVFHYSIDYSKDEDPDEMLAKALKKKGYDNIKWLQRSYAYDHSLLNKTFPK